MTDASPGGRDARPARAQLRPADDRRPTQPIRGDSAPSEPRGRADSAQSPLGGDLSAGLFGPGARPKRADRPPHAQRDGHVRREAVGQRPRGDDGRRAPGTLRPDGDQAVEKAPGSRPRRPDRDRPARSPDRDRPARSADRDRPARSADRAGPPRRGRPGGGFASGPRAGGADADRIGGSRRRAEDIGEVWPEVPEWAAPAELDPEVRRDLRSLSKDNADFVAGHLVAAGSLAEDDPDLAWMHARAARARGGRVAVVRETVGLVAYRAGEWAEAIGELRAARRMGGGPGHLAVIADCERALGHPERAIELSRSADAAALDPAAARELAIVAAGRARRPRPARRGAGTAPAAVGNRIQTPGSPTRMPICSSAPAGATTRSRGSSAPPTPTATRRPTPASDWPR